MRRTACAPPNRAQARQRSDIDDAAVSALVHAGQQPTCEFARRGHHHLDEIGVACPGLRHERTGQAVAGVVDQCVRREAAARDLRSEVFRRGRIGEVGGDAFARRYVLRAQFVASVSRRSARRAVSTRARPRAASSRANAAPTPAEAPVTQSSTAQDRRHEGILFRRPGFYGAAPRFVAHEAGRLFLRASLNG